MLITRLHESFRMLFDIHADKYEDLDVSNYKHLIGWQGMDAIKEMLHRPWWRRLWAHQELLLAQDPIFICGYDAYDGDQIINGMSTLLLESKALDNLSDASLSFVDLSQITNLAFYKWLATTKLDVEKQRKLLDLIIAFPKAKCSDPCDRIFALLSLATDEVAELNPPNYELSIRQV